MSEETAVQLLEELKASIVKQWGSIPVEIETELAALEAQLRGLIPSTESPAAEESHAS